MMRYKNHERLHARVHTPTGARTHTRAHVCTPMAAAVEKVGQLDLETASYCNWFNNKENKKRNE